MLDFEEKEIIERDNLKSGQMIGLELQNGVILKDKDISYLKTRLLGKWLEMSFILVITRVTRSLLRSIFLNPSLTRNSTEVVETVIELMV